MPPEPLGARLSESVVRLIGSTATATDRFGVAVSGGPDSMALLDLAAGLWPGRIEAATVDHGLRADSATEAAMVAAWCDGAHVPHAILRPAAPISGSLQAEARAVRYALFETWRTARGLDWLMTAHHADDQLETLVMRLNRASGIGGMAGIRARRGVILRPLLGERKADLVAHLVAHHIPFASDPSNSDERFDRARLRGRLANADWLNSVAASRTAGALAEADAALGWSVERLRTELVVAAGDSRILTRTDLPREYLLRLLALMIRDVAPAAAAPRGERIDQAIVQLMRGSTLSLGACVVTGGARWTVRPAPPRRAR